MPKYQELDLIFTRDFGLFTAEFWRDKLMAQEVKSSCGMGIKEQVTSYNGKVEKYFRVKSEIKRLKNYIIKLPLSHDFFSNASKINFQRNVKNLRKLIKRTNLVSRSERLSAFKKSLLLMSRLYPWYMMSIFIAGPWSEDFTKHHGRRAAKCLKRQYANRVFSEGLLKEFSVFIRQILAIELRKLDYDIWYANVLRFGEGMALIENKIVPPLVKLRSRRAGYISTKDKFITGKTFESLMRKLGYKYNPPIIDSKQIVGTTAYATKLIKGKVKVVLTVDDVASFPQGAVLVTPMTAPDFLPAMKKAVAIITDEGGVTCHAAITARELKKPCIIGTKVATQVFKDGDLVEVDATRGIVKKVG